MRILSLKSVVAAALFALGAAVTGSSAASADTVTLTSGDQCSEGNSEIISISDVSDATDCWGVFNGNDSMQTGTGEGDGFIINSMLYEFVAKADIKEATGANDISGTDIGLQVTETPGTNGGWSFDSTKFEPYGDFLIALKAASKPGYGVWLFDGSAAASTSGTWSVAWDKDLSHLTVYAKTAVVPLPAGILLLLTALAGLGLSRRRKASLV